MSRPNIPIDTLIQQRHSTDWTARCDAARPLGQTGDARAVDALMPDLQDPDVMVRSAAGWAVSALQKAIFDRDQFGI